MCSKHNRKIDKTIYFAYFHCEASHSYRIIIYVYEYIFVWSAFIFYAIIIICIFSPHSFNTKNNEKKLKRRRRRRRRTKRFYLFERKRKKHLVHFVTLIEWSFGHCCCAKFLQSFHYMYSLFIRISKLGKWQNVASKCKTRFENNMVVTYNFVSLLSFF